MTVLKSKKITCDGAAHTLAEILGDTVQAKWFQLLAPSGNSSDVLIGGSDVTTEGFPLVKGSAQFVPGNYVESMSFYAAAGIHYSGANGDFLYVLYPVG